MTARRNKSDDLRSRLIGTWLHSHEEDSTALAIYRPASFAFPPSRGRAGVRLLDDGKAEVLGPGRDDRSTARAGTWSLDGHRLEVREGNGAQAFEVSVVEGDGLRLIRPRG